MAGGDVQKIAFHPVCTHHLGMGKSILRFSNVFNATHGVGNILEQISWQRRDDRSTKWVSAPDAKKCCFVTTVSSPAGCFCSFPAVFISVMLRASRRALHRKASCRVIFRHGRPLQAKLSSVRLYQTLDLFSYRSHMLKVVQLMQLSILQLVRQFTSEFALSSPNFLLPRLLSNRFHPRFV